MQTPVIGKCEDNRGVGGCRSNDSLIVTVDALFI